MKREDVVIDMHVRLVALGDESPVFRVASLSNDAREFGSVLVAVIDGAVVPKLVVRRHPEELEPLPWVAKAGDDAVMKYRSERMRQGEIVVVVAVDDDEAWVRGADGCRESVDVSWLEPTP